MKKYIIGVITISLIFFYILSARAATVNLFGFEMGTTIEGSATSGTFSVQNSVVRTGTYAFRSNPTTTATGFIRIVAVSADGNSVTDLGVPTAYIRFYFRYATKPASNYESIAQANATGTMKTRVLLNSTGTLSLMDTAASVVATGSTVLAQDTWYRIEFIVRNSSSGSYELRVDGSTELSGTGFNFGASDANRFLFGKSVNLNGNTVDFFYDDVMISDSAFPGAGQISVMLPNANGNYQTWSIGAGSGSHYQIVNEVPPDGNTSYLLSTGVLTNAETEALQDTGTVGISGTINSVKAVAVASQDSTTGNIKARLRSATTDSDATGFPTSTSYILYSKIGDVDPATGSAWVVSALDSIETGAVENALVNTSRMTFTAAMVDYQPGGTPTPTPSLIYRRRIYEN